MSARQRNIDAKKIVIATHNDGKVREINELLAPFGIEAVSAGELGLPEPVEDGASFEENAAIKASSAAGSSGLPALADDSGICVDALDGAPGIYTADWAEKPDGSGRDFDWAMEKLENELVKVGATETSQRSAKFVAVLCLCWPDGEKENFRGEVTGQIVWPPRGTKGFGYDPVFLPEGHTRTFGEMEADEKHGWDHQSGRSGLSHRARAFERFARRFFAEQFKDASETGS